MIVKVQFTDGTIVETDHTAFYEKLAERELFRFSIGSADFYNHDIYALEDQGNHLVISEWNDPSDYPDGGHSCVYAVFGPDKWKRTQFGLGSNLPYGDFYVPPDSYHIVTREIPDDEAAMRFEEWPIQKLEDFGKQGF